MRDGQGLDWLYANDPYAALLTRADYRRRFGILSIGGEEQPFGAAPEKIAGRVVLQPCEPWLKAPDLSARSGAFRLTWLASRAEGDGHRIRWRPRKRNERGHLPGLLLTVEYGEDGRPCGVVREDDEESTREWLLLALKAGPRGVPDLADELLEESSEEHIGVDERARAGSRLGRALHRMSKDGLVTRDGPRGSHKVTWSLRWES